MGRLDRVRHDIALATRSLARSPLFVATTVLSLASGIACSATIRSRPFEVASGGRRRSDDVRDRVVGQV